MDGQTDSQTDGHFDLKQASANKKTNCDKTKKNQNGTNIKVLQNKKLKL